MELSNFIQQLFTTGTVLAQRQLTVFSAADEQQATQMLQQFYQEDIQEMPATAPFFNERAALWAAKYFYHAVQLTVMRDAEEELIHKSLTAFTEPIDAAAMYSADLVLRHLPPLLQLAKGLAPADILVQVLEQTAAAWPFSSVGIETAEIKNEDILYSNESLAIAYADRLIAAKDLKRISDTDAKKQVLTATGLHLETFWPQAATILKNENDG